MVFQSESTGRNKRRWRACSYPLHDCREAHTACAMADGHEAPSTRVARALEDTISHGRRLEERGGVRELTKAKNGGEDGSVRRVEV